MIINFSSSVSVIDKTRILEWRTRWIDGPVHAKINYSTPLTFKFSKKTFLCLSFMILRAIFDSFGVVTVNYGGSTSGFNVQMDISIIN